MGTRIKTLIVLLLVSICLLSSNLKAQNNQNIDLDLIYNEWALSVSESYDDILVFVDEDDFIFDGIKYNSNSNLKFTSYDNNFYLRNSESKRAPVRCGNYIPKYNESKAGWSRGVWQLEEEGDYVFLTLEYLTAEKGKEYLRTKWVDYQILELTEDRMVLEKLTEQLLN